MQFTNTSQLSQQVEAAGDWACSDSILHWSIPLDKLFQAELRLTPRRLSGVYFQASEPGLVSAIRTATGYNIKTFAVGGL